MADIPTTEPSSLRAGDTWKWTKTLADYPAGTWTLKYRYKNSAGGFEIVATASGTDHSVTVSATTTAAYAAGTYNWIAWVEAGTEKFTVGEGVAEVLPDYRSGAATVALDDRSHAVKTLAAIEAWIEGRDMGVAEYEINVAGNSRRLKVIPMADLIKLRERYKREVAAEETKRRLAAGLGVAGGRIQIRI